MIKSKTSTILKNAHARLVIGTALVATVLGAVGNHEALAGDCFYTFSNIFGENYACSGAANAASDGTETISELLPVVVTTRAGFGIDTSSSGNDAINIQGRGIIFRDQFQSSITGAIDGIDVRNLITNSNGFSITTTGSVTGIAGRGISASNPGEHLRITSTDVSGGTDGIFATNSGSGVLTIISTGIVNGNTGRGILASSTSRGLGQSISAATVTGQTSGIEASNSGRGNTTIASTGSVTGTTDNGISVTSSNDSSSMTVTTAAVSGETNGIIANHFGQGNLSITSSGPISGRVEDGIFARSFNDSGSATITTSNVAGGTNGIRVNNSGRGNTTLNVNGIVTGGTQAGIFTQTSGNLRTDINLNSGARVSSASGVAIVNTGFASDSSTVVNTGASVVGAIELGSGSDDLTFDGGDFSQVTRFDGGADDRSSSRFDALTFRNVAGNIAAANAVNWETVALETDSRISFGSGELDTDLLSIGDGASLITNIFSDNAFDFLDVTGVVNFEDGAALDFVFDVDDFSLFGGLSLTFLTADTVTGFNNDIGINFIGLSDQFLASVQLDGGSLSLNFSEVNAVPLPASFYLFGTALAGMAGFTRLRRRRRTKANA